MKRLAIAALAALCAAGCAKDSCIKTETARLAVGSYNIRLQTNEVNPDNSWDNREKDLVDCIAKLDLDVMGLQEVCPGQADYITNSLPQYALLGAHRNDGKRKGEASPVMYRKDRFAVLGSGTFWLSETPDIPGSRSWQTACPRVCTWAILKDAVSGKSLCFANTHTDHKSELARKEGMLLVIRRMREFSPPGTPLIFTGDHNCRETEEPAVAVSKKLRNAVNVSETPPTGPWRTFNGWHWREGEMSASDALKLPPETRNATTGSPDKSAQDRQAVANEICGPRIDYIYVSDETKVKSYSTRSDSRPGKDLYPSDHFPVTAVVEF